MNAMNDTERLRKEAEAARNLIANISDAIGGDDDLHHDMIEGETGLLEACDDAIRRIRDFEVIVAGCDAEIERLQSRKARSKRGVETLRAAIEQAMLMADLKTMNLPTKTLTITERAGKAIIHDEAEIPSEFFDPQPPKLNKVRLSKAVKERTVPGASLSNGSISLTIRSA